MSAVPPVLLAALLASSGPSPPAACTRCHAPIAEQWAESRHARSFTNPTFRRAYAEADEPGWCRSCHAPSWEVGHADDGVHCEVCHDRDGAVATARAPSAAGREAHRLQHDPALGGAGACARCHQFELPEGHPMRRDATPVQDTVEEWRRSEAGRSGVPCQERCRSPRPHRGRLPAPGARDLLRAELRDAAVAPLVRPDLRARRLEGVPRHDLRAG